MNMSLAVWIRIYLAGLILAAAADASAFKTDTHQKLNNKAAVASNLDTYLKEQLGVGNDLEETFKEKKVREWIELGGEAEDEFLSIELIGAALRSRHHFHNPLLPWDQAGLNATSVCPPFFLSGEASIRWAQDSNQGLSGQATWNDARKSLLKALTLPSKADRDAAFARTFQILGQQMHLIADLAAPAHTRNDAHCPSPDGFEAWASDLSNQSFIQGLLAGLPSGGLR